MGLVPFSTGNFLYSRLRCRTNSKNFIEPYTTVYASRHYSLQTKAMRLLEHRSLSHPVHHSETPISVNNYNCYHFIKSNVSELSSQLKFRALTGKVFINLKVTNGTKF